MSWNIANPAAAALTQLAHNTVQQVQIASTIATPVSSLAHQQSRSSRTPQNNFTPNAEGSANQQNNNNNSAPQAKITPINETSKITPTQNNNFLPSHNLNLGVITSQRSLPSSGSTATVVPPPVSPRAPLLPLVSSPVNQNFTSSLMSNSAQHIARDIAAMQTTMQILQSQKRQQSNNTQPQQHQQHQQQTSSRMPETSPVSQNLSKLQQLQAQHIQKTIQSQVPTQFQYQQKSPNQTQTHQNQQSQMQKSPNFNSQNLNSQNANLKKSSSPSTSQPQQATPTEETGDRVYYCEDENHSKTVLQLLDEQRNKGICTDMIIRVAGKIYKAHSNMLCANSDWFKNHFENTRKVKTNPPELITLPDCHDYTGFKPILDYIYTGKLMLSKNTVLKVLMTACYLNMPYVINKANEFLAKTQDRSNGVEKNTSKTLVSPNFHNLTQLSQKDIVQNNQLLENQSQNNQSQNDQSQNNQLPNNHNNPNMLQNNQNLVQNMPTLSQLQKLANQNLNSSISPNSVQLQHHQQKLAMLKQNLQKKEQFSNSTLDLFKLTGLKNDLKLPETTKMSPLKPQEVPPLSMKRNNTNRENQHPTVPQLNSSEQNSGAKIFQLKFERNNTINTEPILITDSPTGSPPNKKSQRLEICDSNDSFNIDPDDDDKMGGLSTEGPDSPTKQPSRAASVPINLNGTAEIERSASPTYTDFSDPELEERRNKNFPGKGKIVNEGSLNRNGERYIKRQNHILSQYIKSFQDKQNFERSSDMQTDVFGQFVNDADLEDNNKQLGALLSERSIAQVSSTAENNFQQNSNLAQLFGQSSRHSSGEHSGFMKATSVSIRASGAPVAQANGFNGFLPTLGDHQTLSVDQSGGSGNLHHLHKNNYNNLELPSNFPRNQQFSETPTIRTNFSKHTPETFPTMISDNLPSNLLLRQSLGLSPSTDEQFKQSGFTPSGSQISNLFQSVMNANSNKCSSKQLDNSGDFFRSQQSLSSQLSSSPAVLQPSLEKPKREFPCDYCGKVFGRQQHLKRHILTHTGERPFPCLYCEKRFRRSEHLKHHLTRHHPDRPMITIGTGRRGRPVKKEAERQAAIYAAMRESYRLQREQSKEAQMMASLDAVNGVDDVLGNDNLSMDDNMLQDKSAHFNRSNQLENTDEHLSLQNNQQTAIDRLQTIKTQHRSLPNFPISQKSNSGPGTLKSNTSAASLYDKLKQASSNSGLPSMVIPSMLNVQTTKSGNSSSLSKILGQSSNELSMNSNLANTLNAILGSSNSSNATVTRQNNGNSDFQISPSMTSPGNVNSFTFKSLSSTSPNQIPVSNSSSGLSSINRSPESGAFQVNPSLNPSSEQNLNHQSLALIPQRTSLSNQIGTADSGISHPLSNIGSADNLISNGQTIPMNPSHNWSPENERQKTNQQQQSDTRQQLLEILSQSNGGQPDEVVSKENSVLQPKEEPICREDSRIELSKMLLNLNKAQQPPN